MRAGTVADTGCRASRRCPRAGEEAAPLVPTSEQQVFQGTRGSVSTPAVAVRPVGAATSLDYPMVRLDTAERAAGVDAAAVEGVVRLLETAGREAALADGFREPLPEASAGALRRAVHRAVHRAGVHRAVHRVHRGVTEASTEASTDASGGRSSCRSPGGPTSRSCSTSWPSSAGPRTSSSSWTRAPPCAGSPGPAPPGRRSPRRRSGTTLAQFDDGSSAGLWFFTTEPLQVVPLRPLDAAAAGVDQRAALEAGASQLEARLAPGGTDLFGTALAAVRAVREGYDPEAVSSVVLVTDGRQDAPGGPAPADVLAALRAEADPERPVRLLTVGISPDVDPAELRALAEATGGAAYLAEQPEDLQAVLADALRRR